MLTAAGHGPGTSPGSIWHKLTTAVVWSLEHCTAFTAILQFPTFISFACTRRSAAHLEPVLPHVVEGQRLRRALALVVAAALADAVDVAEVALHLGCDEQI